MKKTEDPFGHGHSLLLCAQSIKSQSLKVSVMNEESSDLKRTEGSCQLDASAALIATPNADLVRLMLTTLALKNSELYSQGRLLGTRPDHFWYQNHLSWLGISASLLQVRHNLKRLCRSGVLVEHTNRCPLRSSLDRILSLRFQMFESRLSESAKAFLLRVLESIRIGQRHPVQAYQETKLKGFLSRIIFIINKRLRR